MWPNWCSWCCHAANPPPSPTWKPCASAAPGRRRSTSTSSPPPPSAWASCGRRTPATSPRSRSACGACRSAMRELSPSFLDQRARPHRRRRASCWCRSPASQHTFGLSMVYEFFRRAGWNAWSGPVADSAELAARVASRMGATSLASPCPATSGWRWRAPRSARSATPRATRRSRSWSAALPSSATRCSPPARRGRHGDRRTAGGRAGRGPVRAVVQDSQARG